MENKLFSEVRLLTKLLGCFFFVSWILSTTSCNNNPSAQIKFPKDSVRHWLNWNVFFVTNSDSLSREASKKSIEDSLRVFARRIDSSVDLQFSWSSCPCDPSLANLDAKLVGGSGDAVTTPPTQNPPGASGDFVMRDNIKISIPEALHQNHYDTSKKVQLTGISGNGEAVLDGHLLAVIDTGLDTLGFQPSIRNLLWKDGSGPTLFNFLLPNALGNLSDDNRVKHGTAVTALALQELKKPAKPQVMALKAFDRDGHGTIYSVSCALSYAIKNKATLINASWGYYGQPDPVLYHYVKRADSLRIPIIAAAGNTSEPHPLPLCGNVINTGNKLDWDRLFFPACFSPTVRNLISVTGLSEDSGNQQVRPCYYQNYSDNFVFIGVLNKESCCQYSLPFLPLPIEGTSFATPVVSGQYLFTLQTTPNPGDAHNFIDRFSRRMSGPTFTVNGNYIIHAP